MTADFQIIGVAHPAALQREALSGELEYRLTLRVMTDGGPKLLLLRLGEEDWKKLSDQFIEMLAVAPIDPHVR